MTLASPVHQLLPLTSPTVASAAVKAAGPLLDVRQSHLAGSHGSTSDEEVKDIYAYGAGLHSTNAIVGLSDFTHLQTLSLHGNRIERIEGLEVLHQLVTLNLSSNMITWMEGLSQLNNLRVLNLSNNRIREIAGLQGLVALRTLILSHNEIKLLGGLSALQGPSYALQHLDLRDNVVEYLCEFWILGGCSHLEEVIFQCNGYANPVCKASAYRSTLLSVVPSLQSLDGSSCVDQARPGMLSGAVPSLWALHHSYPALQNPVENQNHESTCFPQARPIVSERQDQLPAPNNTSPRQKYQGRHRLENTNESSKDFRSQATQEPEHSDDNCAKRNHAKFFQQEAMGSARSNAENFIVEDAAVVVDSIVPSRKKSNDHEPEFHSGGMACNIQYPWSKANDNEEPDDWATSADNSRYVRFVGKNTKSALLLSQLRRPGATDQITQTTMELATQTESGSGTNIPDQLSLEVNHLQPTLSSITVVIDGGNASYTGIGKQNVLANMELNKKDNEVLSLTKEKKLLEAEFAALKKLMNHERNYDDRVDDTHKSVVFRTLEMNLQGCKLELYKLRNTVMQTEKELTTEVKHVESSIIKHIVLKDVVNLSLLRCEILALKEALNSATNNCQTVRIALSDSNQQNNKAKKMLVSLNTALDEQRSKVKIVTEMMEKSTHQERKSRRECSRLQSELDLVCQNWRKNKDREIKDLLGVQSVLWQAQGQEEAVKLRQQWADELHRRLVCTQTLIFKVLQGNARAQSSLSKLRDMMIGKMMEIGNALEAVTEKEKGAKELITELSFVVSAQKKRSESMQFELDHVSASKHALREEVERLQAEISRLQERSNTTEQKAMEADAMRWELANVKSTAERERRSLEEASSARVSSLLLENEGLAERASSLMHKVQETHNFLEVKSEVCERQEAIIQQLKEELIEARDSACVSEANIKALESDLIQRLEYEVDQKSELCNEMTLQEKIISELEEELKISMAAKHGAEQACKFLQEKVNNVDLMLRHVDEEINGIKTLYEGREKNITNERNDAVAKVTALQKKLEDAEAAAASAMQAHFESTKSIEAKEQKTNAALIQKDILIEDLKNKVLEVEAKLHSQDVALETQKIISSAKVEQLSKLLEELREVT